MSDDPDRRALAINDIERMGRRLCEIESQIDTLLDFEPTLRTLSRLLVRTKEVTKQFGLNPSTINSNSSLIKFEEIGHQRIFIEIGEVSVVKSTKRGARWRSR